MTYKEILSKVSSDLSLPERVVDRAYKSYWKVIREHIVSLPLKEDLTDEEFLKLQPNVNIPSIGKLYVTLDRYGAVKKVQEIIKENTKNKRQVDVTHKEN